MDRIEFLTIYQLQLACLLGQNEFVGRSNTVARQKLREPNLEVLAQTKT